VLLWGADPLDPPNTTILEAIRRLSIGVANPMDRIAFCKRGGDVTVHAKVTIIDDMWTAIGSANCMRRSLYTDGELSIGVLDEATPSFAQRLRADLWREHCFSGTTVPMEPLLDIDSALGIWNHAWGTAPGGYLLKPEIEPMQLPFQVVSVPLGTVEVHDGSPTVIGTNTFWPTSIEDRLLLVQGARGIFQIAAVTTESSLTLTEPYRGATGAGLPYIVSERGKWLFNNFPPFDQANYDLTDGDSRMEF
jgi:hypothetical protein